MAPRRLRLQYQRIGISQDLIDNSIINGITINYRAGTPGTPTALETKQAIYTNNDEKNPDALKNLLESHQAYIVNGQRVCRRIRPRACTSIPRATSSRTRRTRTPGRRTASSSRRRTGWMPATSSL